MFNDIVIINNFYKSYYSWNDFLLFFNHSLTIERTENSPKSHAPKTIGHVNFWHDLTFTIDNLTDAYFNNLTELTKTLELITGRACVGKFAAISLTTIEPTTGIHSDPVNVGYLSCIGEVEWRVYLDEEVKTYRLLEGDIIFIPANITHEVMSKTPRAAISFMFGQA